MMQKRKLGVTHPETFDAGKRYFNALIDSGNHSDASYEINAFERQFMKHPQKDSLLVLDFLTLKRQLIFNYYMDINRDYDIHQEVLTARKLHKDEPLIYAQHVQSMLITALDNVAVDVAYSNEADKRKAFLTALVNDLDKKTVSHPVYTMITRLAWQLPALALNNQGAAFPINEKALFYDALINLYRGSRGLGREKLHLITAKGSPNTVYDAFADVLLKQLYKPREANTELSLILNKDSDKLIRDDTFWYLKKQAPRRIRFYDVLAYGRLATLSGMENNAIEQKMDELEKARLDVATSMFTQGRHAASTRALILDYLKQLYATEFYDADTAKTLPLSDIEKTHVALSIGHIHHLYDRTASLFRILDDAQVLGISDDGLDFLFYTNAIREIHAGNSGPGAGYFKKIVRRAEEGVADKHYASLALSYLVAQANMESNKAAHARYVEQAKKLSLEVMPVTDPVILWSEVNTITLDKNSEKPITSLTDYFYAHSQI